MEAQVVQLLAATQQSAAQPRVTAELSLKQLYANDKFPYALVRVGLFRDYEELDAAVRLAALINLRLYIEDYWSPSLEGSSGKVYLNAHDKEEVRQGLLTIISESKDSRIVSSAGAAIAKIAKADFPEEWPTLLDQLLHAASGANDDIIRAILVVLKELIEGGLDEDHFIQVANPLIKVFSNIAFDDARKLSIRAHAINVFRDSLDFVENLRDRDEVGMTSFIKEICDTWAPFFVNVIRENLPPLPADADDNYESQLDRKEETSHWNGLLALKTQVLLILNRMQNLFLDAIPTEEPFSACWDSLKAHGTPFYASYVGNDRQCAMIDIYNMPYTLDSLVIEELDYLQTLLESPRVKDQFDGMLAADGDNKVTDWITEVMGALVIFSCITAEAEAMWDIDFNIFLSDEAFAESNPSPRNACASFLWKLCSWLPSQTLQSLLGYIKVIFSDPSLGWRHKEAALYMLQQIVEEHKGEDRPIDPNVALACVEFIQPTMADGNHFLRARGHIVMAAVMTAWMLGSGNNPDLALSFAQQSLHAMATDESDLVKTSCVRLFRDYLLNLPKPAATAMQGEIVNSIAAFLDTQDMKDLDENSDLVDAVLHTLRDTVMANPSTCLEHNCIDVMLTLVKFGAARDHTTTVLIEEAFESAAQAMATQGPEMYEKLCNKVLPSLNSALDLEASPTAQKTSLTDVALSLIVVLAENAHAPLPPGFVASAMPRLCRLIFSDAEFYQHQQATLAIKHMLSNDHLQVFNWEDPDTKKSGLEILFLVIGHLLGPQVNDTSAAEVGNLAVEVVEKAGAITLGNSMRELLHVVAVRLATAEHLTLIQSLTLVFVRLSLVSAADVLDFLADIHIPVPQTTPLSPIDPHPPAQLTGLEVVFRKWLENTAHFVGFDAIRQNALALVTVYRLHDPRLAHLTVAGDLVVDNSSRIRTRSMAKATPIQHTAVSAQLKIVKVLVNELVPFGRMPRDGGNLLSPTTTTGSFGQGRSGGGNESPTGSWESDSGGSGGVGLSPMKADDATQRMLLDFFVGEGADDRFLALWGDLREEERERVVQCVEGWRGAQAQGNVLAASGGA